MQVSLIENKIYEIRGHRVMLDYDLAEMYDVETKVLKQSVKRKANRFPLDFMFTLTKVEYDSLRSQSVTLENHIGRGKYSKYLPFAFTEQGVAMLSSVLNSEKAIDVNIAIIRTFVLLKEAALSNKELVDKIKKLEKKYNNNFKEVFKALDFLINEKKQQADLKNRKRIGFKPDNL